MAAEPLPRVRLVSPIAKATRGESLSQALYGVPSVENQLDDPLYVQVVRGEQQDIVNSCFQQCNELQVRGRDPDTLSDRKVGYSRLQRAGVFWSS